MNLYDISSELLNLTDSDTGEITDWSAFEALQLARDEKIENIGLYIKNLRAEAEAYKAEKDSFAAKQKRAENKAESLKKYLDNVLNGSKFKSTKLEVSYRKSTSVYIPDEFAVPDMFVNETIVRKADKTLISKALKEGKLIYGATLVESNNIQIK